MKKITHLAILSFSVFVFFFPQPNAHAYWVWSPEAGKFVNPETEVQGTPQEVYDSAMELYKNKELKKTVGQLRSLLKKYPGAQVAPEAQYRLGVIYEEMGDYYKAFRAYRDLLQRYPQNERMSEVIEREFRIGNLFLAGKKAKVMGLEILPSGTRAVEVFKHIAETAPYSAYGDQSQFNLGLAYKKSNQFDEAIEAFQNLIDSYPESQLLPQAQYQIADTAYLQSVVATRDQRVVDRASEELGRFLKRYPDSNVTEKAARLRQEIDEKNAEKNYRIALFYEKENFLDSAFIYYRDVSERYPDTQWGHKAKGRLQALEKPAEYLKSQEAQLTATRQEIEEKLQSVSAADLEQKKDLEGQLTRVKKDQKELEKSKPETLKRRRSALAERERELKEKEKALQKKRKRFAKNLSDDLKRAFDQWQTSLEKEKAGLAREKLRIKDWEKSLGVDTAPFYTELIPFGRETPSPIEQVREAEEKRLNGVVRQETHLLKKKESLYLEYEKLVALHEPGMRGDSSYEAERERLQGKASEIEALEKKLQEKQELYKRHFGASSPLKAVWEMPKTAVGHSVSLLTVGLLNPFDGSSRKDWQSKSPEELQALEEEWRQKIATQKALVDAIAKAFDEELAYAEEKRLTNKAEAKELNPTELRRTIKQIEREIRSHYNEIQDRNSRKNQLLEELEQEFQAKEKSQGAAAGIGKAATFPFRGVYKFGQAFLFGIPERDVKLTEEAKKASSGGANSDRVQALRKEIELESLLIDVRNRDIQRLEREVESLRAQASLTGSLNFRSLLVKFPYVFIREAITSANRLIPKEGRKEKLIEELNQETAKLEGLRQGLNQIETLLSKKGIQSAPAAPPVQTPVPEPAPDSKALKEEISSLERQLELKREDYQQGRERFDQTRWSKLWSKLSLHGGQPRAERRRQKIENELIHLIEKEQKLHQEESQLLLKKKEMVGQFLTELPADLFTEELHRAQNQIESRLNENQKRQNTLSEELKRFRPQGYPPS